MDDISKICALLDSGFRDLNNVLAGIELDQLREALSAIWHEAHEEGYAESAEIAASDLEDAKEKHKQELVLGHYEAYDEGYRAGHDRGEFDGRESRR